MQKYDQMLVAEAVLLALHEHGAGLTTKELAREISRDPRGVARRVGELAEEEKVKTIGELRRPHYARVYVLTDFGREEIPALLRAQKERRENYKDHLDELGRNLRAAAVEFLTAPDAPFSADLKRKLRDEWAQHLKGGA